MSPAFGHQSINPESLLNDLAAASAEDVVLATEHLNIYYGDSLRVKDVTIGFPRHAISAIIGPSGVGKSTFLRALNRLHEVVPGGRVTGRVLLDGQDLYAPGVDPVQVRRHIGMVFQRPNPFPTMSIRDNVLAGLTLTGREPRHHLEETVEQQLREVGLWDEVKDRLGRSGADLSGGQQQRLVLARALAVQPEVVLLDEPTSALDPIGVARFEDALHTLKQTYTIIIVTHNMQQATRVADRTAFFTLGDDGAGVLVEYGPTEQVFQRPHDPQTAAYVTGRVG
jgi:phosphate transport system ATP-binding protein